MKNAIFFVVLAMLTVAALVGWRAMKSQPSSNSDQVAEATSTPTPTPITGTAIGRESSANAFDSAVPTQQVSSETDVTKGGTNEFASGSLAPTTAPPNTNSFTQPSSGSVVAYTNNGFNPKTLTVKSGTMVKFINQSGNQMWIISADVSGGKKLDGMDMGVSVGKDGSYEYQFNSVGSWGYTNKNNQSQTGVVIVN